MTTTIWIGSIRRQRSALDRSDLRLLAWGSSGVALGLRDWSVVVFRFALENFFFFFFFYKALSDFWFRSDFWFSDLLCIGVFLFLFFGEFVGTSVICWLLGLPWALLEACRGLGSVTNFFFFFQISKFFLGPFLFFFFFLLESKANKFLFIYLRVFLILWLRVFLNTEQI